MRSDSELTLIISPHMDDATLSLGGALLAGNLGKRPLIVNVFSISNYTVDSLDAGDVEAVTKMRKGEEIRACELMKAEVKFLDFPEVQIRGLLSVRQLNFKKYRPKKDPIYGDIKGRLKHLITISKPCIALFPLGLGGHVEHCLLNSIGRDFLSMKDTDIGFYEELPYASGMSVREIERAVRRIDKKLVAFRLPGIEIDNKIALLRTYESQMRNRELDMVRQYHSMRGEEHVWAPRRLIDKFHPL
jgi:LmbE family N-acetylglucosaminyl deacetylase